jgi:hypothetical protein
VTRSGTVPAAAVGLVCLLAVLALVQWGGHGRAPFGADAGNLVEQAVRAADLRICSSVDAPDAAAAGAVAGRAYEIAAQCPGDTATVVVDRFDTAAGRDAAARRFESLVRPRGSGVVLTAGDGTVLVRGAGDRGVRERLVAALRDAGAR